MLQILFIICLGLFFFTCEDHAYSNPFDLNHKLDPDEWAPRNIQLQIISDSEIKLNWIQEETRISGFKIERKKDSGSFTQITEVGAEVTEYTETGLNYGTDYTYRVKAFTLVNESGYAVSNTTNTSFPSPSNLSATVISDSTILLAWSDNCSFELGYKIDRSEDAVNFNQVIKTAADVSEYRDTELVFGTDYTYRVQAFTEVNESDFSETMVNFWQDCNGDWGGTAVEDCNSDCNGTAVEDCNSDCDGLAFENDCYFCVGGNTGFISNYCGTVTDISGIIYKTIFIGDQVWMAENLKVIYYRNGDTIQHIIGDNNWSTTTGAFCNYSNNESNVGTYGRLYNWYAVNDSRTIAPEGWHIPTYEEWQTLVNYLRGGSGGKLKETGTVHWNQYNTGATNESNFTALPGGDRYYNDGYYYLMGKYGYFWSSTASNSNDAWSLILSYKYSGVEWYNSNKGNGFSVRCVRDN